MKNLLVLLFISWSFSVLLGEENTKENQDFDSGFGWLEIKSEYDGLDVFLDGKSIGKTPIKRLQVTVESHIIEARHDCYDTSPENVKIKTNQIYKVILNTKPKMSWIDISAQDSYGKDVEAEILVDGIKLGVTPFKQKILMCSRELDVVYNEIHKKQDIYLKGEQTEKTIFVFEYPIPKQEIYSDNNDNDSYMDNYKRSYTEEAETGNASNTSDVSWSEKATKVMPWDKALTYCEDLVEYGYSDWRLPTISELRTLIQNCHNTDIETGGCQVSNDCLSSSDCWYNSCGGCSGSSDGKYSKLKDKEWFWSYSELSDDSGYAWGVDFYAGAVLNNKKSINYFFVRCIRSQDSTIEFKSKAYSEHNNPERGRSFVGNSNGFATKKKTGSWNVHGLLEFPFGVVLSEYLAISSGLNFGVEFSYGRSENKFVDFAYGRSKYRFVSFSMLGKIGISVDFMSSWFGVRSVDFKLNTQMNVWYAFGVGPQIEALFGFEENHNMYFAGVSMWALNIPFYLWGVEQYGFSWTIINVDIGWNLENTSKQQFVFYTSFGLHL